mmetsp:Transcript_6666/g.19231  ORF Transcript_6666/g.19231 Transcript_6666/m.19231 type:complete len:203 (+) Transcript_6666:369-977(+)
MDVVDVGYRRNGVVHLSPFDSRRNFFQENGYGASHHPDGRPEHHGTKAKCQDGIDHVPLRFPPDSDASEKYRKTLRQISQYVQIRSMQVHVPVLPRLVMVMVIAIVSMVLVSSRRDDERRRLVLWLVVAVIVIVVFVYMIVIVVVVVPVIVLLLVFMFAATVRVVIVVVFVMMMMMIHFRVQQVVVMPLSVIMAITMAAMVV